MNIILRREGDKVFYEDKPLRINPQRTKGPNNEVVDVSFMGEEYQKWISLSRLKEGDNEIELKPRTHTTMGSGISHGVKKSIPTYLNEEEKTLVKEYQSKIDEIMEKAYNRYNSIKRLSNMKNIQNNLNTLTDEEKSSMIAYLEELLGQKA